ncbi:MAG: lysophospholipid acyltransferase family protein [Nitrospiraceae bacterium]
MSGVLYWFLWVAVRGLGRLYFGLRVDHAERVPRSGGVLLAANHASYLDIPILGCGAPRRLWYMGRRDLFPVPGFRWIFRALGWIPIRPDRLDRQGFTEAIELIRQGKAVVIYPEGGRTVTGDLRHGKPGLGMIVAQTNCPVVPVHLGGTFEAMPPGRGWPKPARITVRFGEAIQFPPVVEGAEKAFYQQVSREVMARIAELGQVDVPTGTTPTRARAPRETPPTSPSPTSESLHAERGSGLS